MPVLPDLLAAASLLLETPAVSLSSPRSPSALSLSVFEFVSPFTSPWIQVSLIFLSFPLLLLAPP